MQIKREFESPTNGDNWEPRLQCAELRCCPSWEAGVLSVGGGYCWEFSNLHRSARNLIMSFTNHVAGFAFAAFVMCI